MRSVSVFILEKNFGSTAHSRVVLIATWSFLEVGSSIYWKFSREKAVAERVKQDSSPIVPGTSSNEAFSRRIRARHESANGD